ncbi:uncharacterized protein BP01DRAFT_83410 [Aspergillus saccharolyticus JOP 1030-1]|uniref:Secreted protein n=1 Tax=Aspergillus saccharolyticus JOP 1030-1 TaxID=1450539 RepID=A0A318ZWF0_9EURO|nr:hypothetical protein BP01DRAFT_83410 [Aspergillus saccharolyticus JOP 1030-1]PYH44458.1 hypothetical protein BP01DRAFT_83410 [Aspergillus saccharolyticus JOP 1030-1]
MAFFFVLVLLLFDIGFGVNLLEYTIEHFEVMVLMHNPHYAIHHITRLPCHARLTMAIRTNSGTSYIPLARPLRPHPHRPDPALSYPLRLVGVFTLRSAFRFELDVNHRTATPPRLSFRGAYPCARGLSW